MLGASQTQGAQVLNCPGCGTQVADGTTICPSCDYIIDNSFISTDAPQNSNDGSDDEVTPPPRKPAAAAASRPVRTASGVRAGSGSRPAAVRTNAGTSGRPRPASSTGSRTAAPAASSADATNIKSMDEILKNAPQRSSAPARGGNTGPRPAARKGGSPGARPAAAPAPAPRRAPETVLDPADMNYVPTRDTSGTNTGTGQIVAPEQVIDDVRDFWGVLGRSDRIAFAGACSIIVSAFLPWKETAAEGDILGLMSLGLVGVMAAIGILGAIMVRVRRTMPNLNVLIPWLAQLGLSAFCILWCIIFMKVSYDATEVPSPMGNATIMNSTPSFGVVLALLGALTSLGGTLLGLKEKPVS